MINTIEARRGNHELSLRNQIVNHDPPRISIRIGKIQFTCILDTGSSANVMSQNVYEQLRNVTEKIITLPTCGLYCSGALGKRRQRIKLQCMLNIEIDGANYELIFLVVPTLSVDIIIGCEFFVDMKARVDFEENRLRFVSGGGLISVPFLKETAVETSDVGDDDAGISQDTFFVEYTRIDRDRGVANMHVKKMNDESPSSPITAEKHICADCANLFGISELIKDNCEENDVVDAASKELKVLHINNEIENDELGIMINKVKEVERINESQREALERVIVDNGDVFTSHIGKCNSYVHSFRVTDLTPFNHKSRPIPSSLMSRTDDVIDKMIAEGIIEPSDSQYINPLCIVVKADGSIRLTIDARELNRRSVPNHYRNEPVEKLLNRINGARYFSSIDLSSSFWQIELAEECRDFTAFIHRGRQYRFCRTPFGISSSSAALIRALSDIFSHEIDTYAAIFVDDFCVMDKDFDTHLRHVDYILRKLRLHGFSVKAEKTQLIKEEIKFLGFVISEQGIRANREKIDAIMDIPPPKNIRQLRRFLGICQYQARFLINYAKEVQPLRELLRKGRRWKWSERECEAFQQVKKLFAESIMLQRPDYERPFIIYCDASYRGIGCILIQENQENETRVIATASRSLNNNELRMFATEIEVCAIYFALQKFREYIFGRKVTVRTDNISLEFMQRCKLTSSRISRYIHEITAYHITIEHVKGTKNTFADLLSRLTRARDTEKRLDERGMRDYAIMRIETRKSSLVTRKLSNLSSLQDGDPLLKAIKDSAEPLDQCSSDRIYGIKEDVLYKLVGKEEKKWLAYIPASLVDEVISMYHECLGHSGVDRLCLTLEQDFYVKKLGKKARQIVSCCELCQKAKPMNVKFDMELGSVLRNQPNELICVDTHGPMPTSHFGFKYIFVLYDVFSKFIKIYPLKKLSTIACTNKILNDYVPKYGKMDAILSDNASIFASRKWRENLERIGIRCFNSSRYHAASNPCERSIRDIGIYFRIMCHKKQKEWSKHCKTIEDIMNKSPNPTTRVCPETLQTGVDPPQLINGIPQGIPIDPPDKAHQLRKIFDRLQKRAEERKKRAPRHKRKWIIEIGDQVLVKDHKLSSRLRGRYHRMELLYKGPMDVTQQFGDHTFELMDPKSGRTIGKYHKQLLRPYKNKVT